MLSTLAMLSASGLGVNVFTTARINRMPSEKMNLTEEELEKLASLEGKEKKKYVKELREKYANNPRERSENG